MVSYNNIISNGEILESVAPVEEIINEFALISDESESHKKAFAISVSVELNNTAAFIISECGWIVIPFITPIPPWECPVTPILSKSIWQMNK